jgi:hypothetical protein
MHRTLPPKHDDVKQCDRARIKETLPCGAGLNLPAGCVQLFQKAAPTTPGAFLLAGWQSRQLSNDAGPNSHAANDSDHSLSLVRNRCAGDVRIGLSRHGGC